MAAAVLAAAVAQIGGAPRAGQQQMAAEVSRTVAEGEHLLVQAGTGTGKSLGYLAPALAHLAENPQDRVVIATATLALQAQLATRDIPAAVAACHEVTGATISHAVLKGRSNYACLHRVRMGSGLEQQGTLLGGAELAEAVVAAGLKGRRPPAGSPTATTRRATPRPPGHRSRFRCANAWASRTARSAPSAWWRSHGSGPGPANWS